MKKIIISIFAMLLFAQGAFSQEGEDDLSKIHTLIVGDSLSKIYKLIGEKKYAEALAEHQQYFNDSKGTSASAVRLSFGLSSWAELGEAYPPAHMALVQLAIERKNIIYAGKADFDVFQEYTSINSYIDRYDESIETFLYIEKNYPQQVKHLYPLVEDILIAKKQYDIIKKYADDPIFEFESIRNNRERSLSQMRKKRPGYTLEKINAEFEKKYITLLETTEKIGLNEEVAELKIRYDGYMRGNLLRKYH